LNAHEYPSVAAKVKWWQGNAGRAGIQ